MGKNSKYTDFINIVKLFLQHQMDILTDVDNLIWDDILEEFKNHSITTLAIDTIYDMHIPTQIEEEWKTEIIKQSSHFIKLLHVQNDIAACLDAEKIEWAVLKGTSAAIYYNNPFMRTISDIDILVAENDFDRAKKILENTGCKFGENAYKYDRHITARKDGIEIELHRFFAETRGSGNDGKVNDILFNALSSCKKEDLNASSFNRLPDLENGLVLIEHIWHHIRTGIGLRHILDFIMYVDKVLDDNFWNDSFGEKTSELGYDTLCKVIAKIGQLYFGLDDSITWCKDVDESLCDEFLEMVLSQGNFGSKASEEFNSTIRVLNKKNEGVISFIKYEHASGMMNWKAAQNHKILRPFAWIYGIGRHIVLTIGNKEYSKDLRTNQVQSKKQSDLLNKLRSTK